MLLLAAAALSAQVPASQAAPDRQARATVKIMSGARLRFAEIQKSRPELLRESTVRAPDGSTQTARLVEFQ